MIQGKPKINFAFHLIFCKMADKRCFLWTVRIAISSNARLIRVTRALIFAFIFINPSTIARIKISRTATNGQIPIGAFGPLTAAPEPPHHSKASSVLAEKKAADPKTDGEVLSAINRLQDQYQSAKFEQHFKVGNAADDEP